MSPNFILIINACAYTFLSLKQYKKAQRLNIGFFISAWFALIAWLGVLYYNHELFAYFKSNVKFSIFPFVYLFVAIYLFIYPILRFDSTKIQKIKLIDDRCLLIYIYIMLFVELMAQAGVLPTAIKILSSGASVAFREDSYESGGIVVTNYFLHKLGQINLAFLPVNMVVSIYALLFSRNSRIIRLLFCFSSIFLHPFIHTSLGNRFYMLSILVWVTFIFVFLSNFISSKIKKRLIVCLLVISVPVIISFITISVGRFGNLFEYQLYRYLGEPFVNYNTQFFYDLQDNTWGRAYFTTFRKWFGYPMEFETLNEKWAFLDGITGVDTHVFYTFIGGFNIEFGFVVTLLIGFFVIIVYKRIYTSMYTLTLPKLIALCYLGYVCIQGAFLFPLQGGKNMEILGSLIAYIFFVKISKSKFQHKI